MLKKEEAGVKLATRRIQDYADSLLAVAASREAKADSFSKYQAALAALEVINRTEI